MKQKSLQVVLLVISLAFLYGSVTVAQEIEASFTNEWGSDTAPLYIFDQASNLGDVKTANLSIDGAWQDHLPSYRLCNGENILNDRSVISRMTVGANRILLIVNHSGGLGENPGSAGYVQITSPDWRIDKVIVSSIDSSFSGSGIAIDDVNGRIEWSGRSSGSASMCPENGVRIAVVMQKGTWTPVWEEYTYTDTTSHEIETGITREWGSSLLSRVIFDQPASVGETVIGDLSANGYWSDRVPFYHWCIGHRENDVTAVSRVSLGDGKVLIWMNHGGGRGGYPGSEGFIKIGNGWKITDVLDARGVAYDSRIGYVCDYAGTRIDMEHGILKWCGRGGCPGCGCHEWQERIALIVEKEEDTPVSIEFIGMTSFNQNFRAKRFVVVVRNDIPLAIKDVRVEVRSLTPDVSAIDDEIIIPEILGGSSETSIDDIELYNLSSNERILVELTLFWKDPIFGFTQSATQVASLPNPGPDFALPNWGDLLTEAIESEITSFLLSLVTGPTIPLSWLIEEISGGTYRDSVLLGFSDEYGNLIDGVEVRDIRYEAWPLPIVPYPEAIKFSRDGIVWWSNVDNPLPNVRISYQGAQDYISLSQFGDLVEPEVPIVTAVFNEDGTVDVVPYARIRVEGRSAMFYVHSPAKILVTNPSGERCGYDVYTETAVQEIPDCVIGGALAEVVLPDPILGAHEVQLSGTGTGQYEYGTQYDNDLQTQTGTIHEGELLYSTSVIEENIHKVSILDPIPESTVENKYGYTTMSRRDRILLERMVERMEIKEDVRTGLRDKLASCSENLDSANSAILQMEEIETDEYLMAAANVMRAFLNQVRAQSGKGITAIDADSLTTVGSQFREKILLAREMPL